MKTRRLLTKSGGLTILVINRLFSIYANSIRLNLWLFVQIPNKQIHRLQIKDLILLQIMNWEFIYPVVIFSMRISNGKTIDYVLDLWLIFFKLNILQIIYNLLLFLCSIMFDLKFEFNFQFYTQHPQPSNVLTN